MTCGRGSGHLDNGALSSRVKQAWITAEHYGGHQMSVLRVSSLITYLSRPEGPDKLRSQRDGWDQRQHAATNGRHVDNGSAALLPHFEYGVTTHQDHASATNT